MTEDIVTLFQQARKLPRDSVRENRIVSFLKEMPEDSRASVVIAEINAGNQASLVIANRVINDPAGAGKIFDASLRVADAQSMRQVLEFGITKLGARAALSILLKTEPRVVEKASYWLPALVPGQEWEKLKPLLSANKEERL